MAAAPETIESLLGRYSRVRALSLELTTDLQPEDTVVQSMPDVSPTKWHLAHVTWFFERFVLEPSGLPRFNDDYHYLFNSYYEQVGEMHPRPQRGLLSRPTVAESMRKRSQQDPDQTGQDRVAMVTRKRGARSESTAASTNPNPPPIAASRERMKRPQSTDVE